MPHRFTLTWRSLIWLSLILPAWSVAAQTLPPSVMALLKQHRIPPSALYVSVRRVDSGAVLLQHQADKPAKPASTTKLLTTLAGLDLLGPHYQWQTRYLSTGRIENGVLRGDLIIQGSGDPLLTLERFWLHLQSLRQLGIQRIHGDLVLDNTAFALPPHDPAAFDQQPHRLYNVGADAVLTNFSATQFVIQPWQGAIKVFADPPLENLSVTSTIRAQSGKCISRLNTWHYKLHPRGARVNAEFRGSYRPSCGRHSFGRSVMDNHRYTFGLFRYLWQLSGGQHDGQLRVASTVPSAKLLSTQVSPRLAEVVSSINKYSNNVMARQLLLSIGLALYGKPATLDDGRRGVLNWLRENQLKLPGLVLDNGSGLSRRSRITANGLNELLQYAWQSSYRPEFLASLPLAALDGSMRKRLRKTSLRGRARIKTGFIQGVRSMAGVVHTHDQRYVSVALIIQSARVTYANGNKIQDALLKWVYKQ